jgi:ubiquinone/menaquinone biosynthesis C-methylase UbiE
VEKLYNPYLKKSVSRNYIEHTKGKITFSIEDMIDVLSGWKQDTSDFSLLDIGCGTGNVSNNKSIKRFKNYVGVEPSKEFFEYANKHNKNNNTEFYNCSVENLPFEDESFDFMISIETWYYIKDVNKAAKELSRVLKNNSYFLIYTRNPDEINNWNQIKKVISESDDDLKVHSDIKDSCELGEHFFSKFSLEQLKDSFENVNFQIKISKYKYDRIMIQGEKND